METFFNQIKHMKYLWLLLICAFFSCEEDPGIIPSDSLMTPLEKFVNKEWSFEYIIVESDSFIQIHLDMEPLKTDVIDERLNLRYMNYDEDFSYEFRLEPGVFAELSLGRDQNYQPDLGYWEILENGLEINLIHNVQQFYEVQYKVIELSEERMVRQYERIVQEMDEVDSLKWSIGDTITYTEVLIPRIN